MDNQGIENMAESLGTMIILESPKLNTHQPTILMKKERSGAGKS